MKELIYTVYDRIKQEYGPIVEARNDRHARQQFDASLKGNEYADEYDLYRVGVFDHETGIGTFAPPEKVETTLQEKPE